MELLLLFKAFLISMMSTETIGKTLTIECDGTDLAHRFTRFFSLDLMYMNLSQLHLDKENSVKVTNVTKLTIVEKQGSFSRESLKIRTTVQHFDCLMVKYLQCELFGQPVGTSGFSKLLFKPMVNNPGNRDDVTVSILKENIVLNEVSFITCSANRETGDKEHAEWSWGVIPLGSENYETVSPEFVQLLPPDLKQCNFLSRSRLIYIAEKSGVVKFRCSVGPGRRGLAAINVMEKGQESLGNMLTLTTMILVYTHFILLPCVFSRWNNLFPYRLIKDEADFFMRKMRTAISYILGFAFLTVCLSISLVFSNDALLSCYLAFTITEFLFIFAYATMRFLSNLTSNNKYLKNARIVTSFGAVLVPFIFWVNVKIQGGHCNMVAEILFYASTAGSIFAFVVVSFNREGKFWEKSS